MQGDTLTATLPDNIAFETSKSSNDFTAVQRIKNEIAIRLLQTWLADESGYDEKTWELVKNLIEKNRLSNRSKFDE